MTKENDAKIVAKQHFVTFLSPGSFLAESSTKAMDSWDVDKAAAMAKEITERYGAKPYSFYFTTRGRTETDLDSKEIARSPSYFLGGKVETLEEVEARNDPKEEILRSNMRGNGYKRIWTTTEGWSWTVPLDDDSVVLA